MVSADGKTWDRRSTIGLVSFAVDPDDADHIVAITDGSSPGKGLVTSHDGGRRWKPASSPDLASLSWNRTDGLWGAGPDGGVYRSADAGSTWHRRGSLPGAPEAFLVHGTDLYGAVSDQGIFRSSNGGRTWELRCQDP